MIHPVDAKWLKIWAKTPPKARKPTKKVYYQLPMFPYPSGKLHIGHLRVYTLSDTLARFRKMRGFDVVHPHGWDAFGLPAENAAIENKVSASKWTFNHIDQMREQINRMLVKFDLNRELITCSPEYYKHTQQIFLKLVKNKLAYRKLSEVNWDPVDKTVLANEQIDSQGCSWRSGAKAEKRLLEQWFLKITDFALPLVEDLETLTEWPAEVKKMQKEWIGLSEGYEVSFGNGLKCFTTRVETLNAVKFIAVSKSHKLATTNLENTRPNGLIENAEAINPLNLEPLPVYVADYVVEGYGTDAVMGVPNHDDRDLEFAKKVNLPINCPAFVDGKITGGEFDGLDVSEAKFKIVEKLNLKVKHNTKLRDWLVSRQRFWGAPIPMIHCSSCGVVPVPENELPVMLPTNRQVPLSENSEFINTKCPQCHKPAKRDPDTMDTFMDSSWYFFRYLDNNNTVKPFDSKVSAMMPVDCYVGGIEHAILHLLYSRFIAKALNKFGMWESVNGEPIKKLVTQGMVHGITYKDKQTLKYLKPEEVTEDSIVTMEKMSKSKFNGVDPLEVISKHGADAARAHMLFQAPVPDTLVWDSKKIVGVERWLGKVNALCQQQQQGGEMIKPELYNEAVDLLNNITNSLTNVVNMNTVVSDLMKLTRVVQQSVNTTKFNELLNVLVKAMAPLCPAHAEEFWEMIGNTDVHCQEWPTLNKMEVGDLVEWKIISKGRVTKVNANKNISKDELIKLANVGGETIFKPQARILVVK